MLSHGNIVWTARQVAERTGLRAEDRILSYLPLCHIAEQLVSHHPPMVVGACTVFAESRPYVTALLTLDAARLPSEASAARSEARTPEQAAKCAAFRAYLDGQLSAVNATLARYESIKRFAILPVELTVDGGELTPTMKLKRRAIGERFSAEIEGLYSG